MLGKHDADEVIAANETAEITAPTEVSEPAREEEERDPSEVLEVEGDVESGGEPDDESGDEMDFEEGTDPTEEVEMSSTEKIDLLMLVNPWNAVPENYTVELTTLSNGKQVATVIYEDLQRMFDEMRAEGVYPVVASGYRSAEEQQEQMDIRIQRYLDEGMSQEEAEAEALLWVAKVGYSEHQTGLAVDINADGVNSAGYEVYEWLAEHAWEYGFILRFPEGKTDITGIDYEAWHYRYVGEDAAKEIYLEQTTLEEYLENIA